MKQVVAGLRLKSEKLTFISKSTVYEDNAGAIVVATCPRMTPSSKFIAVKYHWFRDHVGKNFEIEKIDSEVQLADIFTKGLREEKFVKIRKLLCGW